MTPEKQSVTQDELKNLLQTDQTGILLVDVRSGEEYDTRHIPAAHNIPENEIEEHLNDEALQNKMIVTVCTYGGQRSQRTAQLLRDLGVKKVFYLEGGTAGWYGEGRPADTHH